MKLKDKVAIVTGGAQGIGRAYALRFAEEGAAVAIVDLREDGAKKVEAEIAEKGGRAVAIKADVSSEESTNDMAKQVHDRFGRIDILMNNAAIYYDMDLTDSSIEYLRKMLDVNLLGILICGRAVFSYMREVGGGSIINISSIAGLRAHSQTTYTTTKTAVIGLTFSMAADHGKDNIRVNCIAPGLLHTPMTAPRMNDEQREQRKSAAPLGTEGTAWDVG